MIIHDTYYKLLKMYLVFRIPRPLFFQYTILLGVTIGFEQTLYQVNETSGRVTIFVAIIDGSLARPVEVTFFSTNGSATSTAPRDYRGLGNIPLQFTNTTRRLPIRIDIVNDNILENTENFFGNLRTSDVSVDLSPRQTEIQILEEPRDGKIQFSTQ